MEILSLAAYYNSYFCFTAYFFLNVISLSYISFKLYTNHMRKVGMDSLIRPII